MDDSRQAQLPRASSSPSFPTPTARRTSTSFATGWGQNTEEVFYDLADEYGLLILNDFWESTQDFQLEAQDPALFLANAPRYHPALSTPPVDCRVVRTQ